MPVCKKCNESFPNIVVIDGKQTRFQKRTKCISCSPITRGRNKVIKELNPLDEVIICAQCNKEYRYKRTKKQGHTRKKCNSCLANNHKISKKQALINLYGGKCKLCGYSKCNRALNFHHVDESTKLFGIGGSHARSMETLINETEKCIMVCANCHMEIHQHLIDENLIKALQGHGTINPSLV